MQDNYFSMKMYG